MLQEYITEPKKNDVTKTEFETRSELWNKNITSNKDFNLNKNSEKIIINNNHIKTDKNFSFEIPTVKNIETSSGTCKDCKLNRISLTLFPWSGKKIRAIYDVDELPEKRKDNKFASHKRTKSKVLIVYDIQSNQKENVCLLLDRVNFWKKYSENEIPLLENI